MSISQQDFEKIAKYIKKKSGIHLTEDKLYLLETRLMPVATKNQCKNIAELSEKLSNTNDDKLITEVTEALTTNESSFFRDVKPFDQIINVIIPRILAAEPGKKKIRIWSAACSTGQEPYSVMMKIMESGKYKDIEFEILASDFTSHVIEKAKSGIYTQFEVQRGVPITMLVKYLEQQGEDWKIKPEVSKNVKFEQVNLIEDFTSIGKFDIVLCRNVLIYFDMETKSQVLHNIGKVMSPKACLILGSSESVYGIENEFVLLPDSQGIYCLRGSC